MSAPFKLTAFDLLLVSLFAVVVIVGIASNPAAWLTMILFILVFGPVMVAGRTWTIRHNQRMALRNVNELAWMVGSIVSDSPRHVPVRWTKAKPDEEATACPSRRDQDRWPTGSCLSTTSSEGSSTIGWIAPIAVERGISRR